MGIQDDFQAFTVVFILAWATVAGIVLWSIHKRRK